MYLGIETSSAVSSVAVMDDQRLIGELTVQAGLTHSEQLVPHIELLLKQSGVAKNSAHRYRCKHRSRFLYGPSYRYGDGQGVSLCS